jgi:hypothetical protein
VKNRKKSGFIIRFSSNKKSSSKLFEELFLIITSEKELLK